MSRSGRPPTSTSNFGVGRREGHDASAFYARFAAPELSDDETVLGPDVVTKQIGDPFIVGDARSIDAVPDGSVALVVTSPPYFAGKAYEEELERDGIPASYEEYLELLADVFAECKRTLEPGGRIAVNVANLGRRPYRSLSADVIGILQDRLGLLLRAEIIWRKGEGAGGSCAWGSFQQPTNPTVRDLTERIIVASKGRFDRARTTRQRMAEELPHRASITADRFMENTLDVWEFPPASATRTGHPAPFPVELPQRLIDTYTWVDDLVLDPFMGAGSTLVAAALRQRRFVGVDLDPAYVELARTRVALALEHPSPVASVAPSDRRLEIGAIDSGAGGAPDQQEANATRMGKSAKMIAELMLENAGFTIAGRNVRVRGSGVQVDLRVLDQAGGQWYVDVSGAFGNPRGGLRRADAVFKAIGRAHAIHCSPGHGDALMLLVSSHVPEPRSEGDRALRAAGPQTIFDVIAMLSSAGQERLAAYASGGLAPAGETEADAASPCTPLPGYWTEAQIDPVSGNRDRPQRTSR